MRASDALSHLQLLAEAARHVLRQHGACLVETKWMKYLGTRTTNAEKYIQDGRTHSPVEPSVDHKRSKE